MLLNVRLLPCKKSEPDLPLADAIKAANGGAHDGAAFWRQLRPWLKVTLEGPTDLLIYPHRATTRTYREICDRYDTDGRSCPTLIFLAGDSIRPTKARNTIVYRDSILKSYKRDHEEVLPAFVADPFTNIDYQLQEKAKPEYASVSFCGYVGTASRRLAYRVFRGHQKYIGLHLRSVAVSALNQSRLIDSRTISKAFFRGGSDGSPGFEKRIRDEFMSNLLGSDYALCVRGNGNFSYRFYEAIASGRIPVVVDTDSQFPLEDQIPYRELCVWVPRGEVKRLDRHIAAFHAGLSCEQFNAIRFTNRSIWLEKLSTVGFHRAMARRLAEQLGQKNS